MKLAIISHTEHYINSDNQIVGWGPTITEINNLSAICEEIFHIAPLHNSNAPDSSLKYTSNKINFIPLKPSGGKNIKKLSIILNAPYNILKIHNVLKKVDIVQFRSPTGMGLYVLPYLYFFNNKKYWIKYAGNWIADDLPLGNKLQRFWLKKIIGKNIKVTVNGIWQGERKNIISFENPCLDENDRKLGLEIIENKNLDNKINYCFVGALNQFKGVDKILSAFESLENESRIGEVHFIGDGNERAIFEKYARKLSINIIFHGFLIKEKINEIYKICHFIILPSKSEGFPKVIGEGMNYGCIPIVSNVSCINQYVVDNDNGFLIEPNTASILKEKINNSLLIKDEDFTRMIHFNYEIAFKFTFSYFLNKIKKEIFN